MHDRYGTEGWNSGLELGLTLNQAEEMKEFERLCQRKKQENHLAHFLPRAQY